MFDAFDLNAAADGLSHPASAISAFIEHDAKYNSAPRSGQIDAKDGLKRGKSSREMTPKGGDSNEGPTAGNSDEPLLGSAPRLKELPVLSGRGSASSLRLLHTRGSSRSSSASSFASSSSGSRESTATRSDSDLLMLAPRRLGAIPSSADRSTLDFYEHDKDESESDTDQGRDSSGRRQTPEDGSELDRGTRGGAFDLATKFAALKEMFHQNQASKSGRGNGDQQSRGPEEEKISQPTSLASSIAKTLAPTGPTVNIGSSKHGRVSRVSAGKSAAATSTKATGAASASVVGHSRSSKPPVPTRRETKVIATAATSESTEASHGGGSIDKKPNKKEGKAHSGMSLTDLKEEHRAALELLKELGGPTDTEFRDEDMDRSIRLLAARSGKAVSGGVGGPTVGRLGGGRGVAAPGKVPTNSHATSKTATSTSQQHTVGATHRSDQQQQHSLLEPEDGGESDGESPLRPLSSSSSGSLVSRLRSSIALGRVVSHEETTDGREDDSEGEEGHDSDEEAKGPPRPPVVGDADSSPHDSDITSHNNGHREQSTDEETPWSAASAGLEAVNDGGDMYEQDMAVNGAAELQWKQYCANFDDLGATEDDEEEDVNESSLDEEKGDAVGETDDAATMARGYTPVSSRSVDNRYSDEGFEADW